MLRLWECCPMALGWSHKLPGMWGGMVIFICIVELGSKILQSQILFFLAWIMVIRWAGLYICLKMISHLWCHVGEGKRRRNSITKSGPEYCCRQGCLASFVSQNVKVLCLCFLCCPACRIISTIFLDSIYLHWYVIFCFFFLTSFMIGSRFIYLIRTDSNVFL